MVRSWRRTGTPAIFRPANGKDGEDMMDWPGVDETRVPPAHSGAGGPALSDFDLATAVRSDACVLFTGRKDTAESAAYLIHSLSGWRRGPFTVVDCGWPESVVESLLFGPAAESEPPTPAEPYPRMAQAGTILLQDVGRLGPAMQSKLADLPLRSRLDNRAAGAIATPADGFDLRTASAQGAGRHLRRPAVLSPERHPGAGSRKKGLTTSPRLQGSIQGSTAPLDRDSTKKSGS